MVAPARAGRDRDPSGASSAPIISFFFTDTATAKIYTLSLHDALPIYLRFGRERHVDRHLVTVEVRVEGRSEEHTSELQSRRDLVCRLLLEKKNASRISPADFSPPLKCSRILMRAGWASALKKSAFQV